MRKSHLNKITTHLICVTFSVDKALEDPEVRNLAEAEARLDEELDCVDKDRESDCAEELVAAFVSEVDDTVLDEGEDDGPDAVSVGADVDPLSVVVFAGDSFGSDVGL